MHEPSLPLRRHQPELPNGTPAAPHGAEALATSWARELGDDPETARFADLWRLTRPNDPDEAAWARAWSAIEAGAAAPVETSRPLPSRLWRTTTSSPRPRGRQGWVAASGLLAASLLTALGLGLLGPAGSGGNSSQSQPHAPPMLTISLEAGQLGLLDLGGATPTVHTLDTDRLLMAAWGQPDPDAEAAEPIDEFENDPAERDLAMGLVVAEFQIFNHMESIADSEESW